MTTRVKCTLCDTMILQETAERNHGFCAQCVRLSPQQVEVRRFINSGGDPIAHAISLYRTLVDRIADESSGLYWGGIADPEFEFVSFYSFESLHGSFDFDTATELHPDSADEIGTYLQGDQRGYSLFEPILAILKSVGPAARLKGNVLFLGSWAMGPAEIGWMVRYLNDRRDFERYLVSSGIDEAQVDAFNDAYRYR